MLPPPPSLPHTRCFLLLPLFLKHDASSSSSLSSSTTMPPPQSSYSSAPVSSTKRRLTLKPPNRWLPRGSLSLSFRHSPNSLADRALRLEGQRSRGQKMGLTAYMYTCTTRLHGADPSTHIRLQKEHTGLRHPVWGVAGLFRGSSV